MASMIETIEEQMAAMDNAFLEWADACEQMERYPDLRSARDKVKQLYGKFVMERDRFSEMLKEFRDFEKKMRMLRSQLDS